MKHIDHIQTAFEQLGQIILSDNEKLNAVIHRSSVHNAWFTPEEIRRSLSGIAQYFLDQEKLSKWISNYQLAEKIEPKTVAIIMAGNIPLVGFHDFLSVLVAGHRVQIKLSEKDPYLMPWMIKTLSEIDASFTDKIEVVERLNAFDAVIATGSNNSSKYFNEYFKPYPHIIRKNRNGIAVLDGSETEEDLKNLTKDVFHYFGLGCRNISKLYLPIGYDFQSFAEAINRYQDLANHSKYRNNIDYNNAIHVLNKQKTIRFPHLILIEEDSIASRIGVLHYAYYENEQTLTQQIIENKEQIQCIVGRNKMNFSGLESFHFGEAQKPELYHYADGVDTMDFLIKL